MECASERLLWWNSGRDCGNHHGGPPASRYVGFIWHSASRNQSIPRQVDALLQGLAAESAEHNASVSYWPTQDAASAYMASPSSEAPIRCDASSHITVRVPRG